jgi:hypothetical protein
VPIQGGIDERRGPSGLFIVVIPKPDREGAQIRDTIFEEIRQLATIGPSEEEMEKLRNNLFLASVRSRQSSLYRAQQLAEFTLYDNDPELFNTDLQTYLDVTAAQIEIQLRNISTRTTACCWTSCRPPGDSAGVATRAGDPDQPTSLLPQIPARRTKRLPVHRFQPLRSRDRIELI